MRARIASPKVRCYYIIARPFGFLQLRVFIDWMRGLEAVEETVEVLSVIHVKAITGLESSKGFRCAGLNIYANF